MKESLYAAADIGATGIKMAAAVYDGRKLRIVDTYSEPNLPKVKDGHEFADIGHMLKTIRDGLGWLGENGRFVSLGIDTYGNGYGILDAEGKLIQEPYHYRDRRIDGIMDQVHRCFTDWQLYEQMGKDQGLVSSLPGRTGLFAEHHERRAFSSFVQPAGISDYRPGFRRENHSICSVSAGTGWETVEL